MSVRRHFRQSYSTAAILPGSACACPASGGCPAQSPPGMHSSNHCRQPAWAAHTPSAQPQASTAAPPARNRPRTRPFGAETTIKHNKYQCKGTNLLSEKEVLKRDLENAVRAEQHPKQDKCRQHGDAQPPGGVPAFFKKPLDSGPVCALY